MVALDEKLLIRLCVFIGVTDGVCDIDFVKGKVVGIAEREYVHNDDGLITLDAEPMSDGLVETDALPVTELELGAEGVSKNMPNRDFLVMLGEYDKLALPVLDALIDMDTDGVSEFCGVAVIVDVCDGAGDPVNDAPTDMDTDGVSEYSGDNVIVDVCDRTGVPVNDVNVV